VTPRERKLLIQLMFVCMLLAACSQTSLLAANDMGTVSLPVDGGLDSAELEDTAG
jgi:hypothetical protein